MPELDDWYYYRNGKWESFTENEILEVVTRYSVYSDDRGMLYMLMTQMLKKIELLRVKLEAANANN